MSTAPIARDPVDVNVWRQRDRGMMIRYEYAADRKDFQRWRSAPGPCRRPYWHFDELRGRLTVELRKGDRAMCYDLTMVDLEKVIFGWRWLVAQAVRQVRHALTHKDQLQGAKPRSG